MNSALWVVQGLLALLFAFAGAMKFIMTMDQMTKQMPVDLAPWFIYFIGVAEILGAIGLILPGLLRIQRGLTRLAAVGLAVIMIGATLISFLIGPSMAILPLGAGLLCAFVAWGRWRMAR